MTDVIGLCQQCGIITALPVGAITIFRIICIIQCSSLLVSSVALPVSRLSSYVVIMTIIITTCHNVIHIILECVINVMIIHVDMVSTPVRGDAVDVFGGWDGVGWGGVGRANNLHLHFHTNVMLMCVHTYVMLRYCAFLHFPTYIMLRYSTMDSFALSHIHHAACMPPQQTWHTLRLKKRSGKLLQEGPESTKWHCRCSKTHKFPIFRYPSIENESRV